ncbi:MAG: hypothetical protein JNJ40_14900 [Bacteroidia bacterium]|nr:hypothetical protein [Bacteroidia bacterium]
MKKVFIFSFIIFSLTVFPKTPEEHYKEAESYSEKSKQNYILAGAAFAFVVLARYLNNKFNKDEKKDELEPPKS